MGRRWSSLPRGASPHRHLQEAGAQPADLQRLPGVRDRLVADVLAGAVVDLCSGRLDDPEQGYQTAAGLEPAAGQAPAPEVQLLAPARRQQLAMAAVLHVAGAPQEEGELDVLPLGR